MLSICIPTLNEEKFLPATLKSIYDQTFQDFEVIIADKSTDRTREIAKSYGIVVVEGSNNGPGLGRNLAAQVAKGDLLLFLDADTVLPNNTFLADAVKEIEERKLDFAWPDIAIESTRKIDKFFFEFYNWYARKSLPIWPHAPGFCTFARRSAHEQIGGVDSDVTLAEDHDYVQRAKRAGFSIGLLTTVEPVTTSARRFTKDGRLVTAMRYTWTELRMMFIGPYKKELPFEYHMGGGDKEEELKAKKEEDEKSK
ncbi:MAG: glycosyltransferase [Patescibacteria group bacterium]